MAGVLYGIKKYCFKEVLLSVIGLTFIECDV